MHMVGSVPPEASMPQACPSRELGEARGSSHLPGWVDSCPQRTKTPTFPLTRRFYVPTAAPGQENAGPHTHAECLGLRDHLGPRDRRCPVTPPGCPGSRLPEAKQSGPAGGGGGGSCARSLGGWLMAFQLDTESVDIKEESTTLHLEGRRAGELFCILMLPGNSC